MKIAMMTNSYKPFIAGVPISIERLAEGLRRKGHEVVVFAPSYDKQEEEKDIVRYGSLFRNVAGGFSVPNSIDPIIEKRFREDNFDVIHVHHPVMMGDTARYLSKKYGVPLVFTYHTRYEQYLHYMGLSGLRKFMPRYIRHCTDSCDLVIAPTPLMKSYLEEIPVKPPVSVLPTGLPADSFLPDEEKKTQIREKFLQGRKYLFVSVARLAKEKNIEFLLRSMKLVKEKQGNDFKLLLMGDGPDRKHLRKVVEEMSLSEEIVFGGAVPNEEIKNYCHAADLFLFASRSETQGIVLIESMAAGTPVLAVRGTGTEDVVINGKNGYMTEVSETKFASKLMDILEKKEIEILTEGAKTTAESYRSDFLAKEAERIYLEAIRFRSRKEEEKRFGARKDMVYFSS
ncbi:MAG: glycosyltransferase [Suilimivivens sp.]